MGGWWWVMEDGREATGDGGLEVGDGRLGDGRGMGSFKKISYLFVV